MSDWGQFGVRYDQPDYEGPVRTYLIASTPRSGSHLLGHLLLATEELGSPLEYFHPEHLKTWQSRLGGPDLAALLRILFRHRTSPSGWFGVKAHWRQFAPIADNKDIMDLLDFRNYIRVVRRNPAAQAVSLTIARQINAWISFQVPTREPTYDFGSIHAALMEIKAEDAHWRSYFEARGLDPILVEYEALAADPKATIDRIRAAFGLTGNRRASHGRLLPERQSTSLNLDWERRYLSDLGVLGEAGR
jgi:LPS sulfotransferase NodH